MNFKVILKYNFNMFYSVTLPYYQNMEKYPSNQPYSSMLQLALLLYCTLRYCTIFEYSHVSTIKSIRCIALSATFLSLCLKKKQHTQQHSYQWWQNTD